MLKRSIFAFALLASAPAVNAEPITSFQGGASSPASGQNVVYDFDTTTPAIIGSGYVVQSGTDLNGAAPAFADPSGKYLSVLTGGSALINFGSAASGFSFDWGSVDDYNTLTLFGSFGSRMYTGIDFAPPANGDQSSPITNGLFTALAGAGETFSGFQIESSANSFEIDNVAITAAVPEPATWAMMLLGFGAIGYAMRRGKAGAQPTYAV